jgi:hypothetical protein
MVNWISPPQSSIPGQVSSQMYNSWNLVSTAFNSGINTLEELASQEYEISWDALEIEDIDFPSVAVSAVTNPTLEVIPGINVSFGGTPPNRESIDITAPSIPDFNEKDYNFTIPGAPNINWPVFYKNPPAASDISIPSAPTFNIPEVPALNGVTIPAPPEYNIPEFSGTLPVDDLTPPTLSLGWGESLYDSNLKTRLGDWLYDQIVNGGTGLDENTEQAIYDRAKSRMEEEEQSLLDSINDGGASKGFPLPTGAYASSILETENKILRTRTDINNDILVNQSKLAQQNTHFVIEKTVQLESVLIEHHDRMQNRSLEAAKFVVTTAAQSYELKVEAYKAKLQGYAVLAQVYQTRIQGEVAKAEFYRSQIEGVKASVDAQRALIDAYRAQVSGIAALVDVYKAQMEAAGIQAGVDRTRMEGFLAEVQAYTARVNAETAKYEGYKAQIAGEVAKIEMKKADAEAYGAKIAGLKLGVDIQLAEAEAKLNSKKIEVEVFNSYVQKFNADVQAALAEVDAAVKKTGLNVDIYRASVEKRNVELDSLVRSYLGKVEEVKTKSGMSIRESEIGVQALISRYQIVAENLRSAAQVAGQMASAAASSVNASVSAGYSDSYAVANQANNSESWSHSESDQVVTEDIHSYSN